MSAAACLFGWFLVTGGFAAGGGLLVGEGWGAGGAAPDTARRALVASALQGESIDQQVASATQALFNGVKRSFWVLRWVFAKAFAWWKRWFRQSALYLAVAFIAVLADGGLVSAWRSEGARVLTAYVPLMWYVYARLLFSPGVKLLPKLLLAAAIAYGVLRRDLVTDRAMFQGRFEDVVFIAVAARFFVYCCPDNLVEEYAARAVTLKRRVASSRRAWPR